jgi:uncharacterized RDD family membrane protein YckC
MTTDFKDVMSQRTDEELIKIVTIQRDDYQPIAVEAAEEEIKKRGIDTTKAEEIKTDLKEKIEEEKEFDSKKVKSTIRLLNFIIDSIAFLIVFAILGFIIGLFYNTDNQVIIQLAGYLLLTVAFFGYYIFMEYKYQKTIGKLITKTKVLRADGDKAQLGDIIARTFCRLIPFDRLSYLFTSNGFHDRLSNTTVIKDDKES